MQLWRTRVREQGIGEVDRPGAAAS
ncbi:MAG: hypothetical protein ACREYE_12655 [Gammaproteobacteria bacterium]